MLVRRVVGINTDDNGNDGNCDDFGNGDDLMIMMVVIMMMINQI